MTRYSIELQSRDGSTEAIPLSAQSMDAAVRELKAWRRANETDADVYLAFYRESDGQSGYINPDGADLTGRPWRHAGGRPRGVTMPCGWCGTPLTARELRRHFTECARRPAKKASRRRNMKTLEQYLMQDENYARLVKPVARMSLTFTTE